MFKLYDSARHKEANSFAWLLGAQMFLILMPAIFEYLKWPWIASLGVIFVMLSSLYIATMTKSELIKGLVIATVAAILLLVDAPNHPDFGHTSMNPKLIEFSTIIIIITYFLYISVSLCRQVMKLGEINLNTVMAAISGYILIGIIGGYLIRLVHILTPGAFNIKAGADIFNYLYFSFVTITTLGFGDILPQEPVGQAIVVVLAVAGQMYLTIVIALIIGQLIAKRN